MSNPAKNRNLAHEIGLCRIALVVEQVHRNMQRHHALANLFHLLNGNADQRACLTYFWWVVLGGNPLRSVDPDMSWGSTAETHAHRVPHSQPDGVIASCPVFATEQTPQALRQQINDEVLRGWLALFRHTALPIIGEDLTRAWIEKAERVAHQAAISEDHQRNNFATAS